MIAGSRGADGCEFDLEVDRECSPRVERLVMIDMMGLEEEPAQNSAAIAYATREAATFRCTGMQSQSIRKPPPCATESAGGLPGPSPSPSCYSSSAHYVPT